MTSAHILLANDHPEESELSDRRKGTLMKAVCLDGLDQDHAVSNDFVPRTTVLFRRIRRIATCLVSFAVVALFNMIGAAADGGLDIVEMRWGFNGKVAPNRFNLLSVLVQNATPQPWEGEIVARKTLGGAGFVDAPVSEKVVLSPFSLPTWVRFYVYIAGDSWNGTASSEAWRLYIRPSSGRSAEIEVPIPRVAKYQRVALVDQGGLSKKGGAFKQMPEELFPAFVSATDGLQVVALDHDPRQWIPDQKQTLIDWLHLGGTLLITQGINGKLPEFTGPLASLNSPLDDGRYGAGRVIRLNRTTSSIDVEEARQILVGLPRNFIASGEKPEDPIDQPDPSQQTQVNTNNLYGEGADPFQSTSFLGQLKEMTKPEHNWILLHLMFWIYIAMIFPGCFLLGKKYSDFRIVYAGLLGTVVLFSLLFSIVGQRGYGESTAIHSVAIARPLPDGGIDVASWSNVFVTNGARYDIRHNGKYSLYATCNQSESVNGIISNGAEAVFNVDIPPFSNREFALRSRIAAGGPKLKVEKIEMDNGRISNLSIDVEGLVEADVDPGMLLLHGSRFYSLSWREGKLVVTTEAGDASSVLQLQQSQNWGNPYGYGYDPYSQRNVKTPKDRFNLMFRPLLSRSLNVSREREAVQVQIPTDIVRVYLYTRQPPEFAVQNKIFTRQEGQVLFCIDLPITVASTEKK